MAQIGSGVTRMPATRAGRALLRARVRLSRRSLDTVLAAGGDPWSSASLLVRAGQLASPAGRNRLATALDGLVALAKLRPPALPDLQLRAGPVLEQRERIGALARRLSDPAPVDVAVIARLSLLAWEEGSPAFAGGRPVEWLAVELEACGARSITDTRWGRECMAPASLVTDAFPSDAAT